MSDLPRRDWPAASEIAAMLDARIETLAMELLPAGVRKGHYWTCGSVDGEAGGSLFIHLTGDRRGRWTDAGTGEFGDGLDLLAACRWRGDKKAAYADAIRWLGIDPRAGAVSRPPRREPPPIATVPGPHFRIKGGQLQQLHTHPSGGRVRWWINVPVVEKDQADVVPG